MPSRSDRSSECPETSHLKRNIKHYLPFVTFQLTAVRTRTYANIHTHIHTFIMVEKGPFEVSLVRADTKEPFQEHVNASGEIFAEVEPDMEYFIRVKSTYPGPSNIVRADFLLDGVGLGYCTNLICGREELHGLWTIQGDTQINKALCFCMVDSRIESDDTWIGYLEVTFSEAIPKGIRSTRDSKSRWTGGIVGGSISATMKKVVKSKEGSLSLITATPKRKHVFNAGKELAKIKIQYCTAFGLIQAGLLPKPPLWEYHRSRYPRELFCSPEKMTPSMIRCLNVSAQPKILTAGNQELGIPEVIVDFFNLVEADDSSVDERGDDQLPKGLAARKLDFQSTSTAAEI